jgi:uncharacterized protein YndB with AHSA1/START domain
MKTFKSFAPLVAVLLAAWLVADSQNGSAKPMTQDQAAKTMTLTRTFDAPVADVWKHWSDSDKVMKWWGPTGFTSPLARMDFREGGVSLVCMRAPKEFGGFDMYNTWTYKKIVPHERIEFTLTFCDKDGHRLDPSKMGLPPGIPTDVPHVITFKSLGDKKTEMTVTESGYTTDQAVETSRAGLEQCLDKMATSLKG